MNKSSVDAEGNFDAKQSSFKLILPIRTPQVNENKSHAKFVACCYRLVWFYDNLRVVVEVVEVVGVVEVVVVGVVVSSFSEWILDTNNF